MSINTANNRGAVLLIAVVVSSLVLVIGIGILNITTKEIMFSSLNKHSRAAFFAADSGIECAMHWDLVQIVAFKKGVDPSVYPTGIFATSSDSVNERENLNQIGGDAFSAGKFNKFCAGQDAADVFTTNITGHFSAPNDWTAKWDAGTETATTRFLFYPDGVVDDTQPCTLVTVSKKPDSMLPAIIRTEILSEGFSTCRLDDIRRVSRGAKVQY